MRNNREINLYCILWKVATLQLLSGQKEWGIFRNERQWSEIGEQYLKSSALQNINLLVQAIIEGSIKGGIESVSGWEEWFKEKGHLYERIFSDEELAVMANRKDVKNDADLFAEKYFVDR